MKKKSHSYSIIVHKNKNKVNWEKLQELQGNKISVKEDFSNRYNHKRKGGREGTIS